MMDPEKMIDVLSTEMRCVIRADAGCDRDCEHCDLLMPAMDIVDAYAAAINAVQAVYEIKKSVSAC